MLVYLQMIETPEDKETFEVIYTKYKGLMYHVAYDILNNNRDAEDAVHDAFVKIAENIQKIQDPLCPNTKGYVVIIVENKAIDIYRKKKRHPELPLDETTLGVQPEYTGSNGLTQCIAQLSPRYRHVLTLKYVHGFNNREVAKLLDITEANAIKLDQRAKACLRELCMKEGIL